MIWKGGNKEQKRKVVLNWVGKYFQSANFDSSPPSVAAIMYIQSKGLLNAHLHAKSSIFFSVTN